MPPSPPSQSAAKTLSPAIPAYPGLAIHRGAIDQTTITSQAPPDAMARVRAALETMGIVVQAESEYRYRCIRPRRIVDTEALIGGIDLSEDRARADADSHSDSSSIERKATNELATDASKHTSIPSTSAPNSPPTTHIEPPTPLLAPAPYSPPTSSSTKSRSPSPTHSHDHLVHLPIPSSAISATSSSSDVELISAPKELRTITYGTHTEDPGDELRFSVELTRLSGLDGTYSLDIRRLKGNLRSYKFIYDSLRRRVAAAL